MKLLSLLTLSVLTYAASAQAECAYFDFYQNLDSIPIIVQARVSNSIVPICSSYGDPDCTYTFSAEVIEVLKGELLTANLSFSYKYWRGCPGVDTFQNGTEYIFSLTQNDDGTIQLLGNSCGRWGQPIGELQKVKVSLSAAR